MLKKLGVAAVALVLIGPSLGLIGVGLVMNPAASATCSVTVSNLTVGDVPASLSVTTAGGEAFTLNRQQLRHAGTIIETGSRIDGVTRDGLVIALMAALTESTLRTLSNTSAYPESANYPNDGDGSDHDSLGLFQMRPRSGWGSVADLMDPTYQARAFFGGPTGPNHPSPRGLLDIPGWEQLDKGEAAQAVEVSAYPDRYRNYEPAAETILTTLTTHSAIAKADAAIGGTTIGEVGSSGNSTGPHLHFEVRQGGTDGEHTDPLAWLGSHHAADLPESQLGSGVCGRAIAAAGGEPVPVGGDPDSLLNDPTSGGQITARMLHLYTQGIAAFPDASWACYSPRSGTRSEHPLGRACDVTFGNAIGQYPTSGQLEVGWAVTNWMKDHAQLLGVDYLIWQGRIWSATRDAEGWRAYTGGGMHDPGDVTGGHYDHLHVTVRSGR